MVEEDKDESPQVNMDETDEEAQDMCPAFDNDLDSEVKDLTIEEGNHVFMAMVHPVDPHHFVHALSMVSGRLMEAFAKNSKPKGFEDSVLTSLHTYCQGTPAAVPTRANIRASTLNKGGSGDPGARSAVGRTA
jgi:hypothetical protein